MYDINKKFIFTHPPKCGGTSIEELVGFLVLRDRFPSAAPFKHASLETHIQKLKEKKVPIEDIFKVSIIRNPWDRVVSFYNHNKHKAYDFYTNEQPNKPLPQEVVDARELTFNQFVYKHCKHNFNSNTVTTPYMFADNKFFMDYVIRLEHIEEDLSKIKDVIQIDLSGGVPHRNDTDQFTARKPYSEYFDQKTKNYITQLFEWDIKTFNYKFA